MTLWDIEVPFGTVIIYNVRQVTVSRTFVLFLSVSLFSLSLLFRSLFGLALFTPRKTANEYRP